MVALPYGIAAGTLAVWGTVLVQNVRPFGVSEVLAILSTQTIFQERNRNIESILFNLLGSCRLDWFFRNRIFGDSGSNCRNVS